MTITGIHPYANKFPMLPDPEIDELAESIATVGLLHPVVIDAAGLVLDGRNRLEACKRAEVEVRFEVYDGTNIAEYVIACNSARRHMSTGARAMATALVLEADGRRGNGRWKRGSIILDSQNNETSNWNYVLAQAGIVLDFKPDLAEQVVNGSITLNDAFTQAETIRTSAERDKIMRREKAKREKAEAEAEAQRNAEIVADLTQAGAQKYLDMINDETMTPKSAWAAYREDTRKERERAEHDRQGRSDLYSGIAKALSTVGVYGEYNDIPALMADYDPDELNPPMLDRYLTIDNLENALRLVTELIEWRKNYAR